MADKQSAATADATDNLLPDPAEVMPKLTDEQLKAFVEKQPKEKDDDEVESQENREEAVDEEREADGQEDPDPRRLKKRLNKVNRRNQKLSGENHRLTAEMEALKARVDELSVRSDAARAESETERLSRIEGEINTAYTQNKARIKLAEEAGDVDAKIEAYEDHHRLTNQREWLKAARAELTKRGTNGNGNGRQRDAPEVGGPPPQAEMVRERWVAQNSDWLEGTGRSARLAKVVDREMANEGWNWIADPKAYFEELDKRLDTEAPDRHEDGPRRQAQSRPRQTVAGSSRSPVSGRSFDLSDAHMAAYVAAGFDPNNAKDLADYKAQVAQVARKYAK